MEFRSLRPVVSFAIGLILTFGAYLTTRGYHSRDGDQAYRLPLLLHRQIPELFAHDPFVRAIDAFNPHAGYLALLDFASRPLGISSALAILFVLTFACNCCGLHRIAGACWPRSAHRTGWAAILMFLAAKAGNIGTNHLFESMLLDRLIALGLGWLTLASLLQEPPRIYVAAACLGFATFIHPSFGLQIGLLIGVGGVVCAIFSARTGIRWRDVGKGGLAFGVALIPGLIPIISNRRTLMEGLPPEDFFALSALVQSPQHMIPHLWRMPQWLAWGCFPILAATTLGSADPRKWSQNQARMAILLVVTLLGLSAAWVAIEWLGLISVTVFQPFRTATVTRGLCLALIAERVRQLWDRGDWWGKVRACMLVMGLVGDWAFVGATVIDLGSEVLGRFKLASEGVWGALLLVPVCGYLALHDPESGWGPLLVSVMLGTVSYGMNRRGISISWNPRRVVFAMLACWTVPVLALLPDGMVSSRFAAHCRFGERPIDDIERLALWCRDHTPRDARFVTPPGPKTFRLWSLREVAFNRAAGPYHAAGLKDWASRFRDHVSYQGSIADFAKEYLKNRQQLEGRYDVMSMKDKAALARAQGADYVVFKIAKSEQAPTSDEAEVLHREGNYAVAQVRTTTRLDVAKRQGR